jgi:uncharacterized protein YgiM (DUF1202 family)
MNRKKTASKTSGNNRKLLTGWIIVGVIAVIAIGGWLAKTVVNKNQAASIIGAPIIVPPAVQTGEPYAVFSKDTYLRTWPGTDYPVVGIIQQGQQAQIVGKDNEATWWAVLLPTEKVAAGMAWVSAMDVQANGADDAPVLVGESPPPATYFPQSTVDSTGPYLTTGDAVYLRAGPGAEYPVYAILYKNMAYGIIGKSEDGKWWQISMPEGFVGAEHGWIYDQFIKTFNTEDVPIVTPPTPEQKLNLPAAMPDDAQIILLETTYVRYGPSSEYPASGTIERGSTVKVVGISEDKLWWVIDMPEQYGGSQGWIEVVYCYAARVADIKTIPAPPLAK